MAKETAYFDLKDIAVERGGRQLFSGLSCHVTAGEMLVLRGANGCGKSSLMRAVAGFLPLASGTVTYSDQDVSRNREDLYDHMTYLGHQNGLKLSLTLHENLSLTASLSLGYSVSETDIEMAAERLGMQALLDEPVQYFSSGQHRRGALCRLPLLSKKLWLLDEPTVGLDQENRGRLATMMQAHLTDGGMIIAATHEDLGITGTLITLTDYQAKQAQIDTPLNDPEGWLS